MMRPANSGGPVHRTLLRSEPQGVLHHRQHRKLWRGLGRVRTRIEEAADGGIRVQNVLHIGLEFVAHFGAANAMGHDHIQLVASVVLLAPDRTSLLLIALCHYPCDALDLEPFTATATKK